MRILPNSPKKGKIWVVTGTLILTFVFAVGLWVPLGKLGPLGEPAQTYAQRGDTFSVSDPNRRTVAAELRLCGGTHTLQRSRQSFHARVQVSCEGDGEVRLRFADGQQASCKVGYVTPGAAQHFNFRVRGNECF